MISVLTLTYKRHHLLEEAIESFLRQNCNYPCEMVIINDNPDVDYVLPPIGITTGNLQLSNLSHIRIINHKERFPSIAAKLKWGFEQCKYEHIYRLDDDDLLAPNGLNIACEEIINHPEFEIYRSKEFYYFSENLFQEITGGVNNGNIYTKQYINRIEFPNTSGDEDSIITFNFNAKTHSYNRITMIYRWGMRTLHISGMGKQTNEVILNQADKVLNNQKGVIQLQPKFISNYYEQINGNSQ